VLCAIAAVVVVGRGGYMRWEIIHQLAWVAITSLVLLALRTILGRDNSPALWIAPIFVLLYPAMMGSLYVDVLLIERVSRGAYPCSLTEETLHVTHLLLLLLAWTAGIATVIGSRGGRWAVKRAILPFAVTACSAAVATVLRWVPEGYLLSTLVWTVALGSAACVVIAVRRSESHPMPGARLAVATAVVLATVVAMLIPLRATQGAGVLLSNMELSPCVYFSYYQQMREQALCFGPVFVLLSVVAAGSLVIGIRIPTGPRVTVSRVFFVALLVIGIGITALDGLAVHRALSRLHPSWLVELVGTVEGPPRLSTGPCLHPDYKGWMLRESAFSSSSDRAVATVVHTPGGWEARYPLDPHGWRPEATSWGPRAQWWTLRHALNPPTAVLPLPLTNVEPMLVVLPGGVMARELVDVEWYRMSAADVGVSPPRIPVVHIPAVTSAPLPAEGQCPSATPPVTTVPFSVVPRDYGALTYGFPNPTTSDRFQHVTAEQFWTSIYGGRQPALTFIDGRDGTVVVEDQFPPHLLDPTVSAIEAAQQLSYRHGASQLVLVPGDHWTVEELVNLCVAARLGNPVLLRRCVVTAELPRQTGFTTEAGNPALADLVPITRPPVQAVEREWVVLGKEIASSAFMSCFVWAQHDDPDLAAEVVQTVHINGRGSVTSTTALSEGGAHGDLARCLEGEVEAWRFPATVAGDDRWGRWRLSLESAIPPAEVCDGQFAGHLLLGNCIRGSRFHECWKSIAATSTGHSTDARISMTVGADGTVVQSSVSSYGPVNAGFERCVTRKLDQLRLTRWSGAPDRTIDTDWTIDVDWTTYSR